MHEIPKLLRCAELEYILLGDLRDLLEEPADNETARWLMAVLNTLLKTLPEEHQLMTDSGYLFEILDHVPHWDQKVNDLEDEYYRLLRRLTQLKKQVDSGIDFQQIANQISVELKEWMTAFIQHQRQERELFTLASRYEVGGNG